MPHAAQAAVNDEIAASMYERAMGSAFTRLHPTVQRFHQLAGRHVLLGWVETVAPRSVPARLLALCLGTPLRSLRGPIRFELDARPEVETWTRLFPHQLMRSQLRLRAREVIEEHLGAARLRFELHEQGGMLAMRLTRMRFIGIPCPSWLMPSIVAQETGHGEHLMFRVSATVPLVGLIASYHGQLMLPSSSANPR